MYLYYKNPAEEDYLVNSSYSNSNKFIPMLLERMETKVFFYLTLVAIVYAQDEAEDFRPLAEKRPTTTPRQRQEYSSIPPPTTVRYFNPEPQFPTHQLSGFSGNHPSLSFNDGFDDEFQNAFKSLKETIQSNGNPMTSSGGNLNNFFNNKETSQFPVNKGTYGVSKTIYTSSSNINGKQTQRKKTVVTVNDNGNIRTFDYES